MLRLFVLGCLVLCGLGARPAQAGGPDSPPDDPKKSEAKTGDAPKPDAPKPGAPRPDAPKGAPETAPERHARLLEETTVHFDFKRAALEDILRALSKASEVPIALGRSAKIVLDKRRFKIKYVASRRGNDVLSDVCKAASLDYVIRDAGVLVGLPGRIRKLRKSQNLGGQAVKLTSKDVTKALSSKTLSIAATRRSLESILAFLRSETGIPFVQLSEERKKGEAQLLVTISLTSVPLEELLDKILGPLKLDWMQQGRVILVGSVKAIAEQRKPLEPKQGEGKKGEAKKGEQEAGKPEDEQGS